MGLIAKAAAKCFQQVGSRYRVGTLDRVMIPQVEQTNKEQDSINYSEQGSQNNTCLKLMKIGFWNFPFTTSDCV